MSANSSTAAYSSRSWALSTLLADTGQHGHKYAIDAMLSATALTAPGAVTVLTSDPDDLTALCSGRVTLIKI